MSSIDDEPVSKPARRAAFAFVFVTVCLDMLAFGIVMPILPDLILHFEQHRFGPAASMVGLFGFIWAAMQFVFSPVLGGLSDRYGRRPVILLSNLGLCVDHVIMALAPSLPWLFVGRVLSGITSASFSTAGAYIADVTPDRERAARFGMLGAAFGLGFVIGPAVGGGLASFGLRVPFWVAAAISLLNTGYGFFVLPESLPANRRTSARVSVSNPLRAFGMLFKPPAMRILASVSLLYYVAQHAVLALFVLYTQYRYHWSEHRVGLTMAAFGVLSTLVSALLVAPAVKRFGEERVLSFSLLAGCAGFVIFGSAASDLLFLLGMPLAALQGLAPPCLNALMMRQAEGDARGHLQGAISSLRGITGMAGPPIFAGLFFVGIGVGATGLPYFNGAALTLAGAAITLALLVRHSSPSESLRALSNPSSVVTKMTQDSPNTRA